MSRSAGNAATAGDGRQRAGGDPSRANVDTGPDPFQDAHPCWPLHAYHHAAARPVVRFCGCLGGCTSSIGPGASACTRACQEPVGAARCDATTAAYPGSFSRGGGPAGSRLLLGPGLRSKPSTSCAGRWRIQASGTAGHRNRAATTPAGHFRTPAHLRLQWERCFGRSTLSNTHSRACSRGGNPAASHESVAARVEHEAAL